LYTGERGCRVRLPDGSGMNREVHVPFCEKLVGKFHQFTHHKLHWVLDMSFGDDQSRIRKGNAPHNMAIIKKTILNLLQIVKKDYPRISLKRMRKLAGWDNNFLNTVVIAKF
jgi:hypothetical protein